MEYVAGESLEEAIRRHPHGMPADEALDWLRGIAAGVAYLHDHGIVHRDLKPGNIFRDEGIVKLGDYGLSKFISCSRRSGQTESIGTVHYMAPEIANGRYGKEIDIYALGVILYEMLTGRVPFEGESVGEVLMKHLTAEPDISLLAEPLPHRRRPRAGQRSGSAIRLGRRIAGRARQAAGRLPGGAAGGNRLPCGHGRRSRAGLGRRRAGLAVRARAGGAGHRLLEERQPVDSGQGVARSWLGVAGQSGLDQADRARPAGLCRVSGRPLVRAAVRTPQRLADAGSCPAMVRRAAGPGAASHDAAALPMAARQNEPPRACQ